MSTNEINGAMVARVSPTLRNLTSNDSKVLGRSLIRKKEKHTETTHFQTRNFKTQQSNWTPRVHKPSNDTIFDERRELVSNWFDVWSDSQRKRFISSIFDRSEEKQLRYARRYLDTRVPLKRLDPSKVLPRFLMLYVYSFLDPRSLCRASQVSWHWKYVSEQDDVWMEKCLKLGWYLPFTPTLHEYAAWKHHYLACVGTLHSFTLDDNHQLYSNFKKNNKKKNNSNKIQTLNQQELDSILHSRPDWKTPDTFPKDMHISAKVFYEKVNTNNPQVCSALLMHHDKFGLKTNRLRSSCPSLGFKDEDAVDAEVNKFQITAADEGDLQKSERKRRLSASMVSFEEKRFTELVNQPWRPDVNIVQRRNDLSGGAGYGTVGGANYASLGTNYPEIGSAATGTRPGGVASCSADVNPRVLFISSRVPACELLYDAVSFGVISILYEYEAETLESLAFKLKKALNGRLAKSIGIYAHTANPIELNVTLNDTVTLLNLDDPDKIEFFTTIATSTLPSRIQGSVNDKHSPESGHVDIFTPLGSYEVGVEMLIQLNVLTGTSFRSPTNYIGSLDCVTSIWLNSNLSQGPCEFYFCLRKLSIWMSAAMKLREACAKVNEELRPYLTSANRAIVRQLVGEIVYSHFGDNIIDSIEVTKIISEGILYSNKNYEKNTLKCISNFLLEKLKLSNSSSTSKMLNSDKGVTMSLSAQLQLNEAFNKSASTVSVATNNENRSVDNTDPTSEIEEVVDPEDLSSVVDDSPLSPGAAATTSPSHHLPRPSASHGLPVAAVRSAQPGVCQRSTTSSPQPGLDANTATAMASHEALTANQAGLGGETAAYTRMTETGVGRVVVGRDDLSPEATSFTNVWTTEKMDNKFMKKLMVQHPNKRRTIAKELLFSEKKYLHKLNAFNNVFYGPLKAALNSNRAILSAQNIEIIFTDMRDILKLTRTFYKQLEDRVINTKWEDSQCLGDVFLGYIRDSGFGTCYVNYLNNYTTILKAVQLCIQEKHLFREYVDRREDTYDSCHLRLCDFLLLPISRIKEYLELASVFEKSTPKSHVDRKLLKKSIILFADLNELTEKLSSSASKERKLKQLQELIENCPILTEGNRYFIKQSNMAEMSPSSLVSMETMKQHHRTYHLKAKLGIYLFNDSVIITNIKAKAIPFESGVELTYVYQCCISLLRLKVIDLPDSKYIQNALELVTSSKTLTLVCESDQEKRSFLTIVENTTRTRVDNDKAM